MTSIMSEISGFGEVAKIVSTKPENGDNSPEAIRLLRERRREAIEGLQKGAYGRAISLTVIDNPDATLLGIPAQPIYSEKLAGYMLPQKGGLATLIIIGGNEEDEGRVYRQKVKIPPDTPPDRRAAIESSYRYEYGPNAEPFRLRPHGDGTLASVEDLMDFFGTNNPGVRVTHRSDRPQDRAFLSESILSTVKDLKAMKEQSTIANTRVQTDFVNQVLPLVEPHEIGKDTEQADLVTQT